MRRTTPYIDDAARVERLYIGGETLEQLQNLPQRSRSLLLLRPPPVLLRGRRRRRLAAVIPRRRRSSESAACRGTRGKTGYQRRRR